MRRRDAEPDLIIEMPDGGRILMELKKIDAKLIRGKMGLSQLKFAQRFGFGVQQLRTWEQHRAKPSASTLAYLALIEANPKSVAAIFASSRFARPTTHKARTKQGVTAKPAQSPRQGSDAKADKNGGPGTNGLIQDRDWLPL
jgi:putative transcriptional regulator